MSERSQFTFYRSFYDAIKRIKNSKDRVVAYDVLAEYALNGVEPEADKLPDSVAIAFCLMKPTLDTSKRKAENGKRGGTAKQTASNEEAKPKQKASKMEANGKQNGSNEEANRKREQNASEGENKKEKENKKENEIEIEKESYNNPQTPFGRFWAAYPRKVGKLDAEKAFKKVKVPIDKLLSAIEEQKQSPQWTKDGGQFIPNPATWLNQGRWDDVPATSATAQTSSGHQLGEVELAAIKRIMERSEE